MNNIIIISTVALHQNRMKWITQCPPHHTNNSIFFCYYIVNDKKNTIFECNYRRMTLIIKVQNDDNNYNNHLIHFNFR